jgi:hypothetical protein
VQRARQQCPVAHVVLRHRLRVTTIARACMPRQGCEEAAVRCRKISFVRCSKLGSGRAVLVGDAAHAIAPNIACGAASALEDGVLLAACVEAHMQASGSLEGIAKAWTATRLADAHALTNISRMYSDLTYFKLYKQWSRWLLSLPVGGTLQLSFILPALPLPGALLQRAVIFALSQALGVRSAQGLHNFLRGFRYARMCQDSASGSCFCWLLRAHMHAAGIKGLSNACLQAS